MKKLLQQQLSLVAPFSGLPVRLLQTGIAAL